MTVGEWFTLGGMIAGFIFQGAILLAGAAAAWGKIQETAKSLGSSIDNLTASINRLDDKLDSHAERISRLEAVGQAIREANR